MLKRHIIFVCVYVMFVRNCGKISRTDLVLVLAGVHCFEQSDVKN